MRGVDVSSWNGAPFNDKTEKAYGESDFIVAKTTQGTGYVNPAVDYAIGRAKADGKPWGFYHYASGGDPIAEADHFLANWKEGGLPVIDWESGSNPAWGDSTWVRRFVDRVHEAKGVWCVLYTGMEGCRQCANCAELALWFAGYPVNADSWDVPAFPYSVPVWGGYGIWQFTGNGVDRNVTEWTRDEWERRTKGEGMVRIATLAADVHRRMVEDDRFGYSWVERWGANLEAWDVDGVKFSMKVGDYDCSSSTITAWNVALAAAGRSLLNATYTGNMRKAFLDTGLFEWRTDFGNATRGDLYLDESSHVAMCQGNGQLSEFSISETGGTTGKRGDQTGGEAHMGAYYRGSWDGYLHCKENVEVGGDPSRKVWQYATNMTDAQKWEPRRNGDGTLTLVSKACGKALDVQGGSKESGTVVQAYPANGTDAQKWTLQRAKGGYVPEEVAPFELVPKLNAKLRLDVRGGDAGDCADVQVHESNGTAAQQWAVLDDGHGFWTLVNVNSGKALDVAYGGK